MKFEHFVKEAEKMQEDMLQVKAKIDSMQIELQNKMDLYKAFTKQHIGLADGTAANIIELAKAVRQIMTYD